ncbi:hypothetical protein EDD86DRAFT_250279 [Gorgonomyces haynaldii]|nr:hypothetical protein EDD86DRAFT_250279 [Gorgonomyces haynaldii]
MSYIRVKRQRTVYFVEAKITDSVFKVKQTLSHILFKDKSPKDIRLHILGKTPGSFSTLEDNQTLEQVGVQEEGLIYMNQPGEGQWEQVEQIEFEPLQTEEAQ